MRPDEHKRRKNAQYKKKHGTTEKQESANKKEKTKDANKKTSKSEVAAGKPETKSQLKPKTLEDNASDSEEQIFRRRNLVSNWSRYDDLLSDDDDDDVLPSHRGEDFNKLLASAGSSSAQFRFQDEEEWESTPDSSTTAASVLAINLEDLHQSLSCIPLHQRMGVAETYFTETQLKELNELAETNAALRKETLDSKAGGDPDTNSPSKTDVTKNNKESAIASKTETNDSVLDFENRESAQNLKQIQGKETKNVKKIDTGDVAKLKGKPSLSVSDETNTHSTGASTSDANAVIPNKKKTSALPKTDTSSLEDDLDILLSLDKPRLADKAVTNEPKVKDATVKSLEINGTKINKESSTTESSAKSSNKENLEDWLDNMLDS